MQIIAKKWPASKFPANGINRSKQKGATNVTPSCLIIISNQIMIIFLASARHQLHK